MRLFIIIFLTALALMMVSPVVAVTKLPGGVPNTSPAARTFPNQHGIDNLTLHNLTETNATLYIGNIEYPPIFETNPEIIPWQIWLAFMILGTLMTFAAWAYPAPEGQIISSVLGMLFTGYSYVLAAFIGFGEILANPQYQLITNQEQVVGLFVNIIQPAYTIYNPPWLWIVPFAMFFFSLFGLFSGVFNLVKKNAGKERGVRWP